MNNFENSPEHIYIHWPFCKSKCYYCDFISFQSHENFQADYHKALCTQIKGFVKNNQKVSSIKTIFLGGGSPSLYPLDLLKDLFKVLRQSFDLKNCSEITIEVNPADVTEEKLKTWRELGINRLSAGVQILDDKILQDLKCKQTIKDVQNFIKIAPNYFSNISVDLILGLPGTSQKIWNETLQQVVSWSIKHLSLYLLMVYDKTPLFFKLKEKELHLLAEKQIEDMYLYSVKFLKDHGFEQYEISNFAKPGFSSVHNIAYWDRKPYVGFGLAASSFDGVKRCVNEKKLGQYLKCLNSKGSQKLHSEEVLDKKQEILEVLMLGLRQTKGVDLHRVLYLLSNDEREKFLSGIKILKSQDLIQEIGGRMSLTLKGMMLENEVILRLF